MTPKKTTKCNDRCSCCCKSKSYNLTYDTYIVLNYLRRVDWQTMWKFLKENKSVWTLPNNEIDVMKYSKFYLENFDVFMDKTLFHRITLEARDIFDVLHGEPLPVLMDDAIRKTYYDYEGKYGGVNVLCLDDFKLARDFQNLYKKVNNNFYMSFSEYERNHLDQVYNFVLKNSPLHEQISFIENSINDVKFSANYQSVLLYLLNEHRLFDSGDVPPVTVNGTAGTWDTWYFYDSNGKKIGEASANTTANTIATLNGTEGVLQ